MEKMNPDDVDGDEAWPFERQFDEALFGLWEEALRFALDMEFAAKRCGRRACRNAGVCRLRWSEGKPLSCGGGVVSFEAMRTASAAAMFGGLMLMRSRSASAAPRAAEGRIP